MAIITKKDLYRFKKNKEKKVVDEFVDADGSFIEGDKVQNSDTEIEVPNQQTTDDYVNQAIQPNRPIGGISNYTTRRIGEDKIKTLISKLLETKFTNEGMDINDLSKSKSISVNKGKELINTIKKNNLSGEEIGVLLNYVFDNINIKTIPQNYLKLLKSKL